MSKGTTAVFRTARDLLLELREDHDAAVERFRWPRFEYFNWALDWFDVTAHDHGGRLALLVADEGSSVGVTYAELARRSDQVANWLRSVGVRRGSRMIVMLDNQPELL